MYMTYMYIVVSAGQQIKSSANEQCSKQTTSKNNDDFYALFKVQLVQPLNLCNHHFAAVAPFVIFYHLGCIGAIGCGIAGVGSVQSGGAHPGTDGASKFRAAPGILSARHQVFRLLTCVCSTGEVGWTCRHLRTVTASSDGGGGVLGGSTTLQDADGQEGQSGDQDGLH